MHYLFCLLVIASTQFFGHGDSFHFLVDKLLEGYQLAQVTPVVTVDQGEALSVVVGTCGASDAVYVVLKVVRHVVVDDHGNAADVDAT